MIVMLRDGTKHRFHVLGSKRTKNDNARVPEPITDGELTEAAIPGDEYTPGGVCRLQHLWIAGIARPVAYTFDVVTLGHERRGDLHRNAVIDEQLH